MQFIPRLLSTSINNKHLHETRASLRGWRRHRPARSSSDELLCLLGPHLSTAFAFHTTCLQLLRPPGTIFTYAFTYLSKLQLYQLWQRRLSAYGGGWEHLWLMTRDRHSCPRFLCASDLASFFPSASPVAMWLMFGAVFVTWPKAGVVTELKNWRKCLV